MIRKWLKDYAKKQRAKNRCGYWPFQTGRWDPFTDCCELHDDSYVMSQTMAAMALVSNNQAALDFARKDKRAAEQEFRYCVREIYKQKPKATQWFFRAWGEIWIEAAEEVGDGVWIRGVESFLEEDLRNGVINFQEYKEVMERWENYRPLTLAQ